MAVVYSGDAAYIITENPDLDYTTPKQGTNIWYDAMVVTKDCQDVELAHQFMDFMISEDAALKNTEEVGYSSTVQSAFDEMKETTYAAVSYTHLDVYKRQVLRIVHGYHGGTGLLQMVRKEYRNHPKVLRISVGLNQGETDLVLRELL